MLFIHCFKLDFLKQRQLNNCLSCVSIVLLAICCCLSAAIAANSEAYLLNNEGVTAINQNNFPLAIQKLEQALIADSDYSLATQNLAIAYNNYGLQLKDNPLKAIKQFHRAVYLDRKNVSTKSNLDAIITMLGKNPKLSKDRVALGDEAGKSGDFVGAIIEYESALDIADDPDIRQKLATAEIQNKKHPILKTTSEKSSAAHTKDVDFGPYMASLQKQIKEHWLPPTEDRSKRVSVIFKIHQDGKVSNLTIQRSSGVQKADQAALKAVETSTPLAKLPAGSPENVDIEFTFDYNVFTSSKGLQTTAAIVSVDQWRQSTELILQKDLAQAEKCNPPDNLFVASALANLANFYKTIGKWELASSNYGKALDLREKALGTDNPLIANTLLDIAEVYYLQGDYKEAENRLLQALAIEDKLEIHDNTSLANMLEQYAKVLYKTNRVDEANKIYSRISQLRAVGESKPSGNSGGIANSFQKGVQEYNKKNFKAALGLFLQFRKENPKDPNVLFYIGNCYFNLKQKDSGLQIYWTLISNFPNTPTSKQAIAYLKQIAPDFLLAQQQKTAAKSPTGEPSKSEQQQKAKTPDRDYKADDLIVVLKRTGERQNCPTELIAALKDTFNQFPKGVRFLLGSHGCKIYITPSTIEKDPRLQNTQPRGYEEGTTWKNCPGYTYGKEIVICAYVMARDESGWVAAPDPISTLRHETGHEIDFLLGELSEREEYKHCFLLDVGAMDDETKQTLAYYTQKADAGTHESFAEITCGLLGGGSSKTRVETQKLIGQHFPLATKYITQLINNPDLGR